MPLSIMQIWLKTTIEETAIMGNIVRNMDCTNMTDEALNCLQFVMNFEKSRDYDDLVNYGISSMTNDKCCYVNTQYVMFGAFGMVEACFAQARVLGLENK